MFDSILGITTPQLMRLLKNNRFSLSLSSLPKMVLIFIVSLANTYQAIQERRRYTKQIETTQLKQDPIFIIGHWRSGTTFLHNLISLDSQFAFPNLFEVKKPYSFLYLGTKLEEFFKTGRKGKRVMDNVRVSTFSPQEEEFAIAILSLKSPLVGWIFPKNRKYYNRYLTFNDVSEKDIQIWQNALTHYLKKLTFKYEKQLLLKSPTNTGKIKQLLKIFPNAKFIHIHRNPYDVFRSTKHLYNSAIKSSHLQNVNCSDQDEQIINNYKELYDQFFDDLPLLKKNNYCEVAFEDLESDPVKTIRYIYSQLQLDGYNDLEPELKSFFEEKNDYKKNNYENLNPEIKQKIQKSWAKNFENWNYSK